MRDLRYLSRNDLTRKMEIEKLEYKA